MTLMTEQQLDELQNKLGHRFNDITLLKSALTHSSYANENKKYGIISNERLEFLGDSVLGMTVASLIYDSWPDMTEGRMTRLRAELVCERSLAALSLKLGLGDALCLGKGEEKGGGRERPSILADSVEAVLAAVYIDGGFEPVRRLVSDYLAPGAERVVPQSSDYKTALQELIQEKAGQTLKYHIAQESGPDHKKSFLVEVSLNGVCIGSGSGHSKKEAEQTAAKSALADYKKIDDR